MLSWFSETKSECERFNYTMTAETDESDKDGHWKRRRKSKHDEAYTYGNYNTAYREIDIVT